MSGVPGRKVPKDGFSKLILPAFFGGFAGGLLLLNVDPKSIALFFLFGIVGGGVGIGISLAALERVKLSLDSLSDLIAIALGMSYVSLPGTMVALIVLA